MMSIGAHFAMISLDAITDAMERQHVQEALAATQKTVIDLSLPQIERFAGNVLELSSPQGPVIALSHTALTALTKAQRQQLENQAMNRYCIVHSV